jgi:hypothetical protein
MTAENVHSKLKEIGGQAQDLRNFQMAPILFLSVLTYSTSSPHDPESFRKKIDHNLSVGRVKRDDGVPGGNISWFLVGFLLGLI